MKSHIHIDQTESCTILRITSSIGQSWDLWSMAAAGGASAAAATDDAAAVDASLVSTEATSFCSFLIRSRTRALRVDNCSRRPSSSCFLRDLSLSLITALLKKRCCFLMMKEVGFLVQSTFLRCAWCCTFNALVEAGRGGAMSAEEFILPNAMNSTNREQRRNNQFRGTERKRISNFF